MDQRRIPTTDSNGGSTLHDLFALTDEQILEIEPEAQAVQVGTDQAHSRNIAPAVISSEARNLSSPDTEDEAARSKRDSSVASLPRNDGSQTGSPGAAATSHQSPVTSHDSAQPPAWLAAQMKDPWRGDEARELWNGAQQARQEAAAYRAAFATPEDARALKELYPGGANEARAAAERAGVLDEIDRAYFGTAGNSPEQASAARAQLAQTMLRENPAAFREMVFAGLRALEESGAQTGSNVGSRFSATSPNAESTAPQTASNANQNQGGLKSAPTQAPAQRAADAQGTEHDARLAAYVSFEKAANDDLERSVGEMIERTLQQALPNASRMTEASVVGAQHAAPLQARLSQAIRQDVEAVLKGDR